MEGDTDLTWLPIRFESDLCGGTHREHSLHLQLGDTGAGHDERGEGDWDGTTVDDFDLFSGFLIYSQSSKVNHFLGRISQLNLNRARGSERVMEGE